MRITETSTWFLVTRTRAHVHRALYNGIKEVARAHSLNRSFLFGVGGGAFQHLFATHTWGNSFNSLYADAMKEIRVDIGTQFGYECARILHFGAGNYDIDSTCRAAMEGLSSAVRRLHAALFVTQTVTGRFPTPTESERVVRDAVFSFPILPTGAIKLPVLQGKRRERGIIRLTHTHPLLPFTRSWTQDKDEALHIAAQPRFGQAVLKESETYAKNPRERTVVRPLSP